MDNGGVFSCFRIFLVWLACMGAVSALAGAPASAGGAANGDAVWTKAGADEGLRQAFERARYSLQDSGHGTWRGANPAQRLTLEFDTREARLSHPDGSVGFHLTGYGYGDRLRKPAPATLAGTGNRVEYQRGDLTEWYVNGSQGLEQGFTLARPPGTNREGEPLVIALGITGGLLPVQKADDGAVLFESGTGFVLRFAGLTVLDARGRTQPSRLEVRGGEVRLVVEDQGAQYPLVVDPTFTQQQELTASDGLPTDYFGDSVSVSGDTAVIGAPRKNGSQGAAYVFVRSGGVWSQQQELTASDGAVNDLFGSSVSVSGDTAVVGAYHKTINSNGYNYGAAYVFVRSGAVWSQQQELTASDGAGGDFFGTSVSVSGDTAVIGAPQKNSYQGAAYVFVRSGGVWSQQQELTVIGFLGENEQFGCSVSVSGNTAVIGAYEKEIDPTYASPDVQGAAYVFVRSGTTWSQQQELIAPDGVEGDQFGWSVSVSGDKAVIGADDKNGNQGAAYVFVRSGTAWSQQQELTASDGFDFGTSVSVSGETTVIGASTAAYVFVRSGTTWSQQVVLIPGGAVSLSGDTAVIGDTAAPGAAYVFVGSSLGTSALLVGSAGGSSSVVLSYYTGAWTATANDPFLHISSQSASGTGSAVVVFTYDAFTGTGTRTGTLSIAGLTVTVTQAGTNYIGVSPLTTLASSGLNKPYGVAVDGYGNVYIADAGNKAIKEWSTTTQQVTTLVSSGLVFPTGVAVDGSGNLYIADYGNSVVDEWYAAALQMVTLVPSGLSNETGVAVDSPGNVYIADCSNFAIKEWNAFLQDVATLVSSGLLYPRGVAVDVAGNVYIADTNDNAIKQWSPSAQQVITLVPAGLSSPSGVAVDGSGNLYIADSGNSAIKEWSASTRNVTTLVSSGLNYPYQVAVDGSGNVYAADEANNAIYELPYAFVGPASLTEPAPAGTDSLLPVLPATASLTGIFAPTSDQSWLTIGDITSGVVNFWVSANASTSARVGHITVLGQQITVTQNGLRAQTITFGTLSNQVFGAAPFTVGATASSGLTVSFNSLTTSVCTVSGSQVTLIALGTCTVQATQTGSSTYATATPINQSFQVTPTPLTFVPMTPCRIADTRYANGAFGSPSLVGGAARSFTIPSSSCSIPTTAEAYSLNVTAVPHGELDYLTVWPSGAAQPLVSTLNSVDGRIKANAAIIPAGTGEAVSVYATNATDVILDIDGYFVPTGSDAIALAFYPLTPCRIADTRYSSYGSLGPPSLSAAQSRSFAVLSSACSIPSTAQAYSLNFTVVPPGKAPVNYITTYPTGAAQPLASTLNDNTGTIVANAAIVPAGTDGAVSVYSYSATDLIIDINGYFAPPGTGGLSLYSLTPCRVLDSRVPAPSTPPFTGEKDVNVTGSGCGAPATAQAYVFNATVVPPGPMNYLTLWPQGGTQPVVSTLNAVDGAITSNMALVPTTNGSISSYVYVPSTTYLILDIFGYFGP
jgi:streptogramin lyase